MVLNNSFSEELCGSFRNAAPFVEHLRKRIYYKVAKEKDQMIFPQVVSFCNTGGLKIQAFLNIFVNKRKESLINIMFSKIKQF